MTVPVGSATLLEQLHALRDELDADMRERFDRSLPLGELLGDRWARGAALGFGEGANIYESSYVYGDVRVGPGAWIGPFTMLDALRAPIEIGAHCSISAGVHIYTHDAVRRALRGNQGDFEVAPVRIGDCTYVGSQSVILHGVTIGDHCVVGANSLVKADVEPYTVVLGSPARRRGRVVIDGDDVEIVLD